MAAEQLTTGATGWQKRLRAWGQRCATAVAAAAAAAAAAATTTRMTRRGSASPGPSPGSGLSPCPCPLPGEAGPAPRHVSATDQGQPRLLTARVEVRLSARLTCVPTCVRACLIAVVSATAHTPSHTPARLLAGLPINRFAWIGVRAHGGRFSRARWRDGGRAGDRFATWRQPRWRPRAAHAADRRSWPAHTGVACCGRLPFYKCAVRCYACVACLYASRPAPRTPVRPPLAPDWRLFRV